MNNREILIYEAEKAMGNAYAPYSKFKVGAAVRTVDGHIFTGCNVENSSYGATICAERVAIFSAVAAGYTNFDMIAITCSDTTRYAYPCGMCLQVMNEFMPEGEVVLTSDEGVVVYNVRQLLPYGFDL